MRLRNTFLLFLSGASALTAFGCGDSGGGGKADDDASTCEGDDCADGGVGSGDGSSADPCTDGKKSGDETGVDCGGSCAACDGEDCTAGDECASGVCTKDVCAAPSCEDGVQNGSEEDVDCGGSCSQGCDAPPTCTGDCAPTAGFTIATEGAGPTTATASSSATRGSARIASTRYDWGDGTGSGTASTHTYEYAGEYVVTQTVIDAEGRMATTTQAVSVTGGFKPVRFSTTDVLSLPNVQNNNAPESTIRLHDDGTTIEVRGMSPGAVRSDDSIAPRSATAFYFEGERFFDEGGGPFWGFGVATAAAPLDQAMGSNRASFGVFMRGEVTANVNYESTGVVCAGRAPGDYVQVSSSVNPSIGFVVDYRAAHPVIHVIGREFPDSVPSVRCSATLSAIDTNLFALYAGERSVVGPQGRINTGADTENRPFAFKPDEVLGALTAANVAAPIAANQITWGFVRTHARAASAAPQLTAPAASSVAVGTPITLEASASDADEGDISDKVEWTYRPSAYTSPVRGYGSSFTFTPDELGAHVVQLSVTDATGKKATSTVTITVTGELSRESGVRFDESVPHGDRTAVAADGLSVYFTDPGHFKDGIRLNQGLIGDFWYFEATRSPGELYSMGFGLTTEHAELNPYSTHDTPWSMSINITAGVWRDLIDVGNLNVGLPSTSESTAITNQTRYGFAVDYRGATPVVYVLTASGAGSSGPTARLIARVPMPNVHGPVFPFVYSGEGAFGTEAAPAAVFKVVPPFGFTNVAQAIQTAPDTFPAIEAASASDAAALKLGWGL
jgi:PKD domain